MTVIEQKCAFNLQILPISSNLVTIKGTTSEFHSSTHLSLQPFLVDVVECNVPGLIDGIHQPDIFLE